MPRSSTTILLAGLGLSLASGQRTFSMGIPNFPFTAVEQELYNHTLPATSAMGVVNHFWSTACGGRPINYATEGGIAVYRLYIDGETNASIEFTPRSAVGYGPFNPSAGSTSLQSLHEPWSTDLWGKLSDEDGFFFKVKIPFYKSIRLTAQLPAGVTGFNVYTIIRGVESDDAGLPALAVSGYGALPLGTRMLQVWYFCGLRRWSWRAGATGTYLSTRRTQIRSDNVMVPNLGFIPIVNISSGSGLVYAHTVSIVGNPGFLYLEGWVGGNPLLSLY